MGWDLYKEETMDFITGLDIGNGYVKGTALMPSGYVSDIDIPSGVAYLTNTHDMKTAPEDVPSVIADIYNNMDVSFESPVIGDRNRHIFGERGIMSGAVVEEFDVYSSISKANQQLSYMLALGCTAGAVLQDYYNTNHALPSDMLHAVVDVSSLALPIAEYKKYRKEYADNYKKSPHVIMFHNFEQPVAVELTFADVQVIAEGASAHYAIRAKGAAFMDAMLADIRAMGEPLEGITSQDILAAGNTVGIDIGEGTVNYPVFQNGKFMPDVSITFDKGYGAVLNAALERLQDMGYPFGSRKALQQFLNTTPTAMTRNKYRKIKAVVDEEITAFVTEVGMQFSKIMSRVGAFTEVVYVYGGGATPVRDELYPLLIQKSRAIGDGELSCPILYLDSRYSRYLNREGLVAFAQAVASQRASAKPVSAGKKK